MLKFHSLDYYWSSNLSFYQKNSADLNAGTYLQPHYGNGVFGSVYLSAGQHYEVNIAGTPLP